MTSTVSPSAVASATRAGVISDAEAQFFLENGYLVLRGLLHPGELAALRAEADAIMAPGAARVLEDPDYMYGTGAKSGQPVLRRIEYVQAKGEATKRLLGHPFVLRSVEKIMGPDFFPTWDSMVLKMPGEGIIVPWHRDGGADCVGDKPIFNVDFYLDEADQDTCLWVYPGSNRWSTAEAEAIVQRPGFSTEGAVSVPMQPGDVLFHDILLLHGSPTNLGGKLRRVMYYEFRTAHVETAIGPHKPEYITLKQQVLLSAVKRRQQAAYAAGEEPFAYNPPAPWSVSAAQREAEPAGWRFTHQDYWRTAWPQGA